jgi:hypothetical protein
VTRGCTTSGRAEARLPSYSDTVTLQVVTGHLIYDAIASPRRFPLNQCLSSHNNHLSGRKTASEYTLHNMIRFWSAVHTCSRYLHFFWPRLVLSTISQFSSRSAQRNDVSSLCTFSCCEYASAVCYSLLNGRKQRVLCQGLCNQHLMIR